MAVLVNNQADHCFSGEIRHTIRAYEVKSCAKSIER